MKLRENTSASGSWQHLRTKVAQTMHRNSALKSSAIADIEQQNVKIAFSKQQVNIDTFCELFQYFHIPGDLGLLNNPCVDTDLTISSCKDLFQIAPLTGQNHSPPLPNVYFSMNERAPCDLWHFFESIAS